MSANAGKDTTAMTRNVRRVAAASASAAMLFGLAAAGAGAPQAAALTPASRPAATVLGTTNPPGSCNPEEIGQERVGPDGYLYICVSLGSAGKLNIEAEGKAGAAAGSEAQRLAELASDPAHGGKITPGSLQEAKAALGLEQAGRLPGPVTRDPTGAADFIDGRGVAWDVKSFNSHFPPSQGGYELAASITKIGAELLLGEHVILNTTNLSAEATAELQAAVDAAGYGDRVLFWP